MLTNPDQWCVVTHYKENYSLFSVFTSFYHRYYGVKRFLIFCGMPQGRTHESLKQMLALRLKATIPFHDKAYLTPAKMELIVSELVSEDFSVWMASYPTVDFISELGFHKLKTDLYEWSATFLPDEIVRTIVPDSDEFLYVKNPRTLENLDSIGFHFLDVVPSPVWPPKNLKFSLQGWYYRRQAKPLFKYGKKIAVITATAFGRGLQHAGCKTFYFDRNRLRNGDAWRHGTAKSLCCCFALNNHLHRLDVCHDILQETSCCFHMAMTCKKYFLTEKLRLFARLQTDLKKAPVQDSRRSAETENLEKATKTFDRLINHSVFPVIEDNFLLPYLKNCDD